MLAIYPMITISSWALANQRKPFISYKTPKLKPTLFMRQPNILTSSTLFQHRAGMRNEMWWSHYIDLWIVRIPADHVRRTITGTNEMNWTKSLRWMWKNDWMKCVVRKNGIDPDKNLTRPRFFHLETHMEWLRRELVTPALLIWVYEQLIT